jgi:hypothetical protein
MSKYQNITGWNSLQVRLQNSADYITEEDERKGK